MKQTADIIVCIVLTLATVGANASSPCPSDFVLLGDKCYYFGLFIASWTSAESSCQSLGGDLALPLTYQENELLVTYLYNNYRSYNQNWWVGGTDSAQEGTWIWSATNTTIEYSYWFPGEPNNNHTGDDCLQLYNKYNYQWDDTYCGDAKYYICEHNIVTPSRCPYGWVLLGDHCYYFHSAPKVWIDAESTCQTAGGHLAYPVTSQENQLIFNYLQENFGTSGQSWWCAGSDEREEGIWLWAATGTSIDYLFWEDVQPDGSGNCMIYSYEYYFHWDDTMCNAAESFICQQQ